MSIAYKEVEFAFDFVWFGEPYMHTAYYCTENEKFYFHSEYGDDEPLPDNLDNGKYIELPQKNEVGLGRELALEFASEHIAGRLDEVYSAFRRMGAYSKFKHILDNEGVIEQWHEYEKNAYEKAMRNWCKENNIEING